MAAFLFLLVFSVTLSIKLGLNGHIVRNNISRVNEQTLIASEYEGRELSSALYGSLGFKTLQEVWLQKAVSEISCSGPTL